jgi:aspartate kinase
MIVQSFPRGGRAELSFTVPGADREEANRVAREIAASRNASVCGVPHVAKLSLTGVGIRSHAGVADRLFAPLAQAGINIDLISTSEVRVNVLVVSEAGEVAVQLLRRAFDLN